MLKSVLQRIVEQSCVQFYAGNLDECMMARRLSRHSALFKNTCTQSLCALCSVAAQIAKCESLQLAVKALDAAVSGCHPRCGRGTPGCGGRPVWRKVATPHCSHFCHCRRRDIAFHVCQIIESVAMFSFNNDLISKTGKRAKVLSSFSRFSCD